MLGRRYRSGPPKFTFKNDSMWKPRGRGFWASLVIYDLDRGIGRVEQKAGSRWVRLHTLNDLGQQFVLAEPHNYRDYDERYFDLRLSDFEGRRYGTFRVKWPCGDHRCPEYTDAESEKLSSEARDWAESTFERFRNWIGMSPGLAVQVGE